MHHQIRRVGLGLMVAFLAVFAQLNYVQIFAAEEIASRPQNIRALLREYSIKRGDILTADFKPIAESRRTGGRLKYVRTYPDGELYGHITGWYSIVYGADRIERSFNDQLLGEGGNVTIQDIQDRFLGSPGERGDDVVTTIHSRLQEAARTALGDERGAIVALDPGTGRVRAMWSNPSFDPGPLASHTTADVRAYWESLDPTSTRSSLVNIAASRGYPPGSTFKVATAAAALESGRYRPNSTFPDPVELELPFSNETLTNFTKTSCSGGSIDLFEALRVSCDTTFAMIGLEVPQAVVDVADGLGFNERIPFDVSTEASTFPDYEDENAPLRAYAAIGQGDVSATPLQMALVAAAVANGGEVPRPRLVQEVLDPSGDVIERFEPEMLGRAFSPDVAREVTEMMVSVVEAGTGTAAQIPGVPIAGKTGTAQTGIEGTNPHTWFIAFAPANDPKLAIAVIVENGGSFGSEATGGAVAAPIARQVLEADRAIREW